MSNTNTTESTSYSAFERFLIWFLIPIVFTSVLLFVLFYILNFDFTRDIQRSLHNIPVIGSVIPAPKEDRVSESSEEILSSKALKQKDEIIADLQGQIADLESKLQQDSGSAEAKESEVKSLKLQVQALEEQLEKKARTDEEYTQQIQELSSMYAKMNPSKAAPIIQNLSKAESVLVMSMMKPDDRVKILEKMNPKVAADVSIALKDTVPLKDQQLEALRERLDLNDLEKKGPEVQPLSKSDLSQTFANMTPKSAASVLLEMYSISPAQVVTIITGMDSASRSRVLTAMTDQDKELTAEIGIRLGKQ